MVTGPGLWLPGPWAQAAGSVAETSGHVPSELERERVGVVVSASHSAQGGLHTVPRDEDPVQRGSGVRATWN